MSFEYDLVNGVSEEEFRTHVKSVDELRVDKDYRVASPTELREVENLLDVQNGTLDKIEFFVKRANCESCGKELGMNDVIQTALTDAKHSKSAVLHTLLGNKYIVDRPKEIRCGKCNMLQLAHGVYASPFYGCSSKLA